MTNAEDSKDVTAVDKLVTVYESNPILRALVALVPGAAAVEAAALGMYRLWNNRMDIFVEELTSLNIYPAEEQLKQREFLDSFMLAARLVQQISHQMTMTRDLGLRFQSMNRRHQE